MMATIMTRTDATTGTIRFKLDKSHKTVSSLGISRAGAIVPEIRNRIKPQLFVVACEAAAPSGTIALVEGNKNYKHKIKIN